MNNFSGSTLFQEFGQNQVLAGVIGLALAGAIIGPLRKLPWALVSWFLQLFIVKVEVAESTQAYNWVSTWIQHMNSFGQFRSYSVRNAHSELDLGKNNEKKVGSVPNREKIAVSRMGNLQARLIPTDGVRIYWHRNRICIASVLRERFEKDNITKGIEDALVIRVLFGSKAFVDSFLSDAYSLYLRHQNDGVSVFAARWGEWRLSSIRSPRGPDSLVFDGELVEEFITELNQFNKDQAWYASMGIPWRRGYLLYGEPGNGKTSLVLAIAAAIKANIYTLNLGGVTISDDRLDSLLAEVPPGNIILLEEIDTVFEGRKNLHSGNELTFSGLLNALDGISSNEGRILFMTTNHKEKLDRALIRPGRVDKLVYLGNASKNQIIRMYMRFFPNAPESFGVEFADWLCDSEISMARLQEYLMRYRADAKQAISNIEELILDTNLAVVSESR